MPPGSAFSGSQAGCLDVDRASIRPAMSSRSLIMSSENINAARLSSIRTLAIRPPPVSKIQTPPPPPPPPTPQF